MLSRLKQTGLLALLTLVLGVALGVSVTNPVRTVNSQAVQDSETQLLRDIYAKANPSVVSIEVRLPDTSSGGNIPVRPQGQQGQQPYSYAAGSGFLYDTSGHIVTNAHVVDGADRVEVTFSDDTTFHAKIVGIDLDADIAVIQVQGDVSKYEPLPVADSDKVIIGDRAVAIGNPFERSGTMTQGIVSGLHRSVEGIASAGGGQSYQIPDAIQTDAALNPGNSGGPLLDDQARVIGVNEQIASQVRQSSGVSFSIPSNLVKLVADNLIKSGKMEHSWLGISGNSLTLDANETLKLPVNTRGAYVLSVQPGSPAAAAGLKGAEDNGKVSNSSDIPAGGDLIIAIDKQPVKHFDDLTSYLFTKTQVGQTITLTVQRDGKTQDIQVKLGARPHAQN